MKTHETVAMWLVLIGAGLLLVAMGIFLYEAVWLKLDTLARLATLGLLLMLIGLLVWGAGSEADVSKQVSK